MNIQGVDIVNMVEALYRFDLPQDGWLKLVANALTPMLDRDHKGLLALTGVIPDPTQVVPSAVVDLGVRDALRSVFIRGTIALPPQYVADGFLTRSWSFGADLEGWEDIPGVRDGSAAALGVADLLSLSAAEADGRGCWFGSFHRERRRPDPELCLALSHLGLHLRRVHRIRCRIDDGQTLTDQSTAVLDPSGRVIDARGAAKDPERRKDLIHAARLLDQARCRRGRTDALLALQTWQARLAKIWTLVESFERDGQTYILAVENRPAQPGLDLLSYREREVVGLARLGLSNKQIAYDLGLAHATVRVLIARAAKKLGARSRREILYLA